ncbi:kinesin-like protein KIF20A [Nothobranchius furzeri]|uniref:Kinesin-like protein n=3 Tax=Nothobranchius TaxID=28779 RepID=A0A1A7ZSM7_NOTFU|nr:kinesin-like protein KIF20A [Nothobranchius furzeri]XP_054586510.1 kinesin-like protein KIF20A [Nothobranchius furzeri]
MALPLSSPCGYPFEEEEEELPVFESTVAENGGLSRPRLPEISVISPGLDGQPPLTSQNVAAKPGDRDDRNSEKVKVFLRIRPLTDSEREKGEEQGCVMVQDEETLLLKAPQESQNMRAAERGVSQSIHKFSFSKIFGPETTQQQFYEDTMKKMVTDVLKGENRLLYTYGVTNSGKTYTIQGSGRETGLLPRALVSLFRKLQGRLYGALDLKPVMCQDVRQLSSSEIKMEEIHRDSLLKEDGNLSSRRAGTTTVWDSGIGGLSTTSFTTQPEDANTVCLEPDSLSLSGGVDLEEGVQFSIWVSFYEIYNEFLYDLLEASPSQQPRKRATLRLSDDKQGNPYVKDLTWIQVRSAEEAWRILKAGRRSQSFASTHLNLNSSRSHSVFSVRVLHVRPEAASGQAMHISELTVCDLAGSERCKEQRNGERMKEANNINTSLLTLGRCIAALRHNQNKLRPPQVVPFRDSKLTRVLQGFFCGRGTSCMVVNINPCASIYDETLQALKFSAIATQLVHGPSTKTRVAYILSLLCEPAANRDGSTVMEEEEEESDVEDGDITLLNMETLLQVIDVLKREVRRQRVEKEVLEANVREEVVSEVMVVMSDMRKGFNESLEAERAIMEERCEDRIANLQKHLKMFYSQQLQERDEEIKELSTALEQEKRKHESVPSTASPVDSEGPRRSHRLMSQAEPRLHAELDQCRAELDQCRSQLFTKTQELTKLKMQLEVPGSAGAITSAADRKLQEGQRNLQKLRLDLQRLGTDLQSGERACCRNTGGERLRHTLTAADETLAKQNQILMELQNNLTLVKADLRRKAETLAGCAQLPPTSFAAPTTPGSCKKRGGTATTPAGSENHPPQKRPFFQSLFPPRKYNTRVAEEACMTPYTRILRSRQPSPPPSPVPTPRSLRGKY